MIPLLVLEKVGYYIFMRKISIVNAEYNGIYIYFDEWYLAAIKGHGFNFYNYRGRLDEYQRGVRRYIYRPRIKLYSKIYDFFMSFFYDMYDDKYYSRNVGNLPKKYWYSSGRNSVNGFF
ncbi:MAG: hypothetical protein WD512_12210 [Candidatus Paceibacterota bacterium]